MKQAALIPPLEQTLSETSAPGTPRLHGWTLRRKIIAGFVAVLALLATGFGYVLFKIAQVEIVADTAIKHHQPAAMLFLRLSEEINLSSSLLSSYLLNPDETIREKYDRVEQSIIEHLYEASVLAENTGSQNIQGEISAAETALVEFQSQAKKLFKLRNNRNENFPGLSLAEKIMLPHGMEFLSNLNLILSSDSIDASTPEGRHALSLIDDLRYSWVQTMSYFRLYLTNRGTAPLSNFSNFSDRSKILLRKLENLDVEIGFGEIEELRQSIDQYMAAVPAVINVMETEHWRRDTYLMRTEVRPLVEFLRSSFEELANSRVAAAQHSGNQLTEALQDIRVSTGIILLLGLLLGALIASRISNNITMPLHKLMMAARQVANGNLNAEVFVERKDEIGRLSHSFNRMIDNLRAASLKEQSYLDSLKELNQSLENRVQQRTTDLESSQQEIRAILDSVGEGIIVIDEQGFIESINPAAENIFGYEHNQAIGMNSMLLFEQSEVSNIEELDHYKDSRHSLFQASPDLQPRESHGVKSDGQSFPMEFVVTALQHGDRHRRVCIVRDISARKETEEKLALAQQQLVDGAHKSGMAEMATGVLHNIGNILNSVNLSGEEIARIAGNSKVSGLNKANDMLAGHRHDMAEFLANDSKGRKLPDYYIKLGGILRQEIDQIAAESRALIEKTTMMKEVISTQQDYAAAGFHSENLDINGLIEDSLKIQESSLHKWGVKLYMELADVPPCWGQKSKLLQVITNLIKNAKEATADNDIYNRPKEIHIRSGLSDDDTAYIQIADNGCGISDEQLSKIFSHGFTTKEDGHGFGLHSSANAMTEMKGSLHVDSRGPQQGATFTVTLPVAHDTKR